MGPPPPHTHIRAVSAHLERSRSIAKAHVVELGEHLDESSGSDEVLQVCVMAPA
jgi:hypothetical protein